MRRKHKPLVFGLATLVVLGAGGYYLSRDEAGRQAIEDQVGETALEVQIEAERAAIRKYTQFLNAIADSKNGIHKPEYDGYDGFDYGREGDYVALKEGHERRLADLQARLNSNYDR